MNGNNAECCKDVHAIFHDYIRYFFWSREVLSENYVISDEMCICKHTHVYINHSSKLDHHRAFRVPYT